MKRLLPTAAKTRAPSEDAKRHLPALFGLVVVTLTSAVYAASILFARPGRMAAAESHYHFAVAREIASGTFVPNVGKSLPWTVFGDMNVDHYWGYHVLVAPFAALAPSEDGMKTAASAMFVLVFASIYLFLAGRSVPFAWAWALLPAMFSTQDWRYLQLRGGQIVVPLLLAMVHLAFFDAHLDQTRRRVWTRRALLALLAWVGMLSSHGAFTMVPVHVAGAVGFYLHHRCSTRVTPSNDAYRHQGLMQAARSGGQPIDRARVVEPVFTVLGLVLGLTVNPYMDARASTWRFALYDVVGGDPAGLYDDLDVSERHGFGLLTFADYPEWGVLLFLVIGALVLVAIDLRRGRPVAADTVVVAAATLACVLLTARAMRARELAVPFALALFALLARRQARIPAFTRGAVGAIAGGLVVFGLTYHWPKTSLVIDKHLPTDQFDGAGELLGLNGTRPILNIAEADFCMLKWQRSDVVCVQGLSRYFLYANRPLYRDVWSLHDRPDASEQETLAILRRFYERGVRLVTTHGAHRLAKWAFDHPDVMVPLFVSGTGNGAMIWGLMPPRGAP
jgi:hypothetical protein